MENSRYLTVVVFSGGSRLLQKNFYGNEILMRYQYKRRVKLIFPTAIIHTVYTFEIKMIRKEEVTPVKELKNKYNIIREDL
jgi:hypothetical protein